MRMERCGLKSPAEIILVILGFARVRFTHSHSRRGKSAAEYLGAHPDHTRLMVCSGRKDTVFIWTTVMIRLHTPGNRIELVCYRVKLKYKIIDQRNEGTRDNDVKRTQGSAEAQRGVRN